MDQMDIVKGLPIDLKEGTKGSFLTTCHDEGCRSVNKMYFLPNHGMVNVYCHVCGYSEDLYTFLNQFYPDHSYSKKIKYSSKSSFIRKNKSKPIRRISKIMKRKSSLFSEELEEPLYCTRVDKLDKDHMAVLYLKKRKIPEDKWNTLYHSYSFKELGSLYGYDTSKWKCEPRLVIPAWDNDNNITLLQGRSYDNRSKIKYLTIKIIDHSLKLRGVHKIDIKKPIYLFEGPLDAIHIENSLDMCGSDINKNNLCDYLNIDDKSMIIIVRDNEPKHKHTPIKVKKDIESGFSVVIWDPDIVQDDLNSMIRYGNFDIERLPNMVYNGREALRKWEEWI